MNYNAKQLILHITRTIHTTCTVRNNLRRQSVMMNKLMNVKGKSKKKWYEPPPNTLPTMKNLTKTTYMTGKAGVRRSLMLNKMFMKNISDLLTTGSISKDVLGKGLEISKVAITSDFQMLRVYWVCDNIDSGEDMTTTLNRTAGVLRHELSQLRLMGEVPTVVFVKDEHSAKIMEIDRKLAVADYGEGYEPKAIGNLMKADFTINTKLQPQVIAQIQRLEELERMCEDPLPEMSHKVYGLDHLAMTNRMRAARKTNQDAWRARSEPGVIRRENVVSYVSGNSTVSEQQQQQLMFEDQRRQLAEFLHKRQVEQDKMHKLATNKDDEDRNVVYKLKEDEFDEDFEEECDDFYDEENDQR